MDVPSQSVQQMHMLGRRAPMNQDEFDTKFNYLRSSRNRRHSTESVQDDCCVCCCISIRSSRPSPDEFVIDDKLDGQPAEAKPTLLEEFLPIAQWIPKYQPKKQFSGDLYAAVCLGLYMISESLAYAFLAGLPPICGLYTAFVSALLYGLLGTSKFSLLGSNLVLCFMIRDSLQRTSIPTFEERLLDAKNEETNGNFSSEVTDSQFEFLCTLTLSSALIQGVLCAFQLEFFFSLISKQLIAGFSAGVAVRVCLSQVKHIFYFGPSPCLWNFSFTCVTAFWECLEQLNLYTLAIATCALLSIVFARQILSPLFGIQRNSPIPFEFLLVVISSLLSYLFDASPLYGVLTAGHVPQRFRFTLPRLGLLQTVWMDALAIALFSYAMHTNITNAVAKIHKYRLEQRQEAISTVAIGKIGSFFGGYTSGQSINRNKILVNAGASSPLYNLLMLLVLFLAILFSDLLCTYLPVCVFSTIILQNLGEYLSALIDLHYLWRISRLDVVNFVFTAVTTVLSPNVSHALFFSIGFGMLTVVCRSQWPKFQLLVNVTGSGSYYAERNRYNSDLLEESGVAIGRFEAPLLFHNAHQFRHHVLRTCDQIKGQLLGVGLGTRSGSMKSNNTFAMVGPTSTNAPIRSTLLISGDIVPNYDVVNIDQTRVMIVDFSAISTVDVSGLEAMCDLFDELAERKIRLLFASVNANIRNRFKVFGGFELVAKHYFFPSVHDAVLCAQQMGGICAPSVHMSISMNGCRDLIALSNATSNHDFIGHHPPSIQTQHSQAGESLSIANPRASVCESRSGDSAPHVVINKS